jgi:translation initiation factor 1 (eIF-1/SUI1)
LGKGWPAGRTDDASAGGRAESTAAGSSRLVRFGRASLYCHGLEEGAARTLSSCTRALQALVLSLYLTPKPRPRQGGFPVSIEPRAKGKKVTVVHNVSGDLDQLCKDLKGAVGSGGVVRDGNVEVQGEHVARTEAFLMKKGCIKGVSGANKAAAQPVSKEAKPHPNHSPNPQP